MNTLPECEQLWENWKESAHDYLFEEEIKKLFGSSRNMRTGDPHFTCKEINEMTSDQEGAMQKILQLQKFKTYMESLNDFLLRKKIGNDIDAVVQQPKVNKCQRLKVVVCAGRSDNGCYSTRCQAVWHAVHP